MMETEGAQFAAAAKDEQHKGQFEQKFTPTDGLRAAAESPALHQRPTAAETNSEVRGAGCSSGPGDWPLPPVTAATPKEKPFKCPECGKTFRFNSALKKHVLVHTGEKPHKCRECGKGFQFVSDLRKHGLIHSGERPYRCCICGKGFVDVSNFRRHERIHTGEKPFSCPFCDKDFTDKGNVKKHLRVHTGEKPFSCSVCRKDFSFLASYKRHVRIHRTTTAAEEAVQANTE